MRCDTWPTYRTGRRAWKRSTPGSRGGSPGRAAGRVLAYLRGLLGPVGAQERLDAGRGRRRGLPRWDAAAARTAGWNADAVRDELRSYVVEQLGPGGVLIVDETGFIKKGSRSAGVGRQYTGTTGKIDN